MTFESTPSLGYLLVGVSEAGALERCRLVSEATVEERVGGPGACESFRVQAGLTEACFDTVVELPVARVLPWRC